MAVRTAILFVFVSLVAGCAQDRSSDHGESKAAVPAAQARQSTPTRNLSKIASLADRGSLIEFDYSTPIARRGATVWYPVQVSQDHALSAISKGGMTIPRPGGAPLEVRYQRHVEHPNGNWTWVGEVQGEKGAKAVLTFGEKAVFGSIPEASGKSLELITTGNRIWLAETDAGMLTNAEREEPNTPDQLPVPTPFSTVGRVATSSAAAESSSRSDRSAAAQSPASQTVDVLVGYTNGFASRLGGDSQAVTRVTYLIDLANQAYIDSDVPGRIRLVYSMQVSYLDATSNQAALFDLTGVACTATNSGNVRLPHQGFNCTGAARPASLEPLIQAREEHGADLVTLLRTYQSPEQGSCGTSWLLGAGQTPIDSNSAEFAFSVVSDTNGNQFPDGGTVCREEYLAHELGHNMGLQHDREVAQGSDDTNSDGDLLDPEEYGALPYTFGYVAGSEAGNFYTIMSLRRAGATGYRVFSNPRISICGGHPCGVANQEDDALGLASTMPLVAAFRSTVVPFGAPKNDFNGDGVSDVLWRNSADGRNSIWLAADSAAPQNVSTVASQAWGIRATGDFNGDGVSDLVWRNANDGRNSIWLSANVGTPQSVATVAIQAWQIAGVGDFNGDGKFDLFWRNSNDGRNSIWLSANVATPQPVPTVGNVAWRVAGIGDFNGDGVADVLWRNVSDGRNSIWLSANSATPRSVARVADQAWQVHGIGDFNGDGTSDLLWRNSKDGRNSIWLSGNMDTSLPVATVTSSTWRIAAVGDYNGDGAADLLWRNDIDGRDSIWLSANSATPKAISTVPNRAWRIVGG